MVYLVLAIASSLVIGGILKQGAIAGVDRMAMLTVNYAAAAGLGSALLLGNGDGARVLSSLTPDLLGLGIATGVLFIAGFFLYASATARAGMSLSIAVMRIAVAIPFLGSWWIWGERPSALQGIGMGLALAALLLISRPVSPETGVARRGKDLRTAAVLGALFVAGGCVDLALKAFDERFGGLVPQEVFITLVFAVALCVGCTELLRRRRGADRSAVKWGIALGIANFGSAWFLLAAVARIPGTVAFPVNSVAIVAGGAVLGTLVWNERLGRTNWFGIAAAVAALGLLV